MPMNNKRYAMLEARWRGTRDFALRKQQLEQAEEGAIEAEVVANIKNAKAFRDPNARRTDQRFGLWYSPRNYLTYSTQEEDREHKTYCAFVEEQADAKWGVFLKWVEHEQQMWDVLQAMQ